MVVSGTEGFICRPYLPRMGRLREETDHRGDFVQELSGVVTARNSSHQSGTEGRAGTMPARYPAQAGSELRGGVASARYLNQSRPGGGKEVQKKVSFESSV